MSLHTCRSSARELCHFGGGYLRAEPLGDRHGPRVAALPGQASGTNQVQPLLLTIPLLQRRSLQQVIAEPIPRILRHPAIDHFAHPDWEDDDEIVRGEMLRKTLI